MMCTILEKLAAQKPTEEMLVQLFYAQVRVGIFNNYEILLVVY